MVVPWQGVRRCGTGGGLGALCNQGVDSLPGPMKQWPHCGPAEGDPLLPKGGAWPATLTPGTPVKPHVAVPVPSWPPHYPPAPPLPASQPASILSHPPSCQLLLLEFSVLLSLSAFPPLSQSACSPPLYSFVLCFSPSPLASLRDLRPAFPPDSGRPWPSQRPPRPASLWPSRLSFCQGCTHIASCVCWGPAGLTPGFVSPAQLSLILGI